MENARLFTLPSEPPLIYVSVFGTDATELASRIGDGYINTSLPNHELLDHYTKSGGRGPMLPAVELAHQRLRIKGGPPSSWLGFGRPARMFSTVGERACAAVVSSAPWQNFIAGRPSGGPVSRRSPSPSWCDGIEGRSCGLSERGERIFAPARR